MGVLLLRLSGPLQSWGDSSRFTVRATRREPTKSGVVGLLASALGRYRDEPVADLCALEFGVRTDQPGTLLRDFQTARSLDESKVMPLSNRYYLADAKFLVALAGNDELITHIRTALAHPRWPLYLGRRSCVPDAPVLLPPTAADYSDVREAFAAEPWLASEQYRRGPGRGYPDLEVSCDGRDGEACEGQADVPLSFGTVRKYACRAVRRYRVANPDRPAGTADVDEPDVLPVPSELDHDPMGFF